MSYTVQKLPADCAWGRLIFMLSTGSVLDISMYDIVVTSDEQTARAGNMSWLNGYGSAVPVLACLSYLQWMNTTVHTTHAVMNQNRVNCLCFTRCVVRTPHGTAYSGPQHNYTGERMPVWEAPLDEIIHCYKCVWCMCCLNYCVVKYNDQLHGWLVMHVCTQRLHWPIWGIEYFCMYMSLDSTIQNWWQEILFFGGFDQGLYIFLAQERGS